MIVRLDRWRSLARLGHVASEDEARPTLTGILLTLEGSKVRGTATDSTVAAITRVDVTTEPGDPKRGTALLLPARQVMLVEKDVRSLEGFRNKKDRPDESIELRITFHDGAVEVSLAHDMAMFDDESITRRIEVLDLEYPQVLKLITASEKAGDGGPTKVTFDPTLVDRLGKSLSLPAITWMTAGVDKPLVCWCPSPVEADWRGLLMPRRSGED